MSGLLEQMAARLSELERRVAVIEGHAPVVLKDGQSIRRILSDVAAENGIPVGDLVGESRVKPVVLARQEAMRRAIEAGFSSVQVGRAIGGRDHSTVLHGAARAAERMASGSGPVFGSCRQSRAVDQSVS